MLHSIALLSPGCKECAVPAQPHNPHPGGDCHVPDGANLEHAADKTLSSLVSRAAPKVTEPSEKGNEEASQLAEAFPGLGRTPKGFPKGSHSKGLCKGGQHDTASPESTGHYFQENSSEELPFPASPKGSTAGKAENNMTQSCFRSLKQVEYIAPWRQEALLPECPNHRFPGAWLEQKACATLHGPPVCSENGWPK